MAIPAHWNRPGSSPEPFDPVPLELPAGTQRPETLQDIFARLMREERARKVFEESGYESPEEADDFDLEDEDVLDLSRYEFDETSPEALEGYEKLDPVPEPSLAPKAPENSSPDGSEPDQGESAESPRSRS